MMLQLSKSTEEKKDKCVVLLSMKIRISQALKLSTEKVTMLMESLLEQELKMIEFPLLEFSQMVAHLIIQPPKSVKPSLNI
jgi:hypothetical protein